MTLSMSMALVAQMRRAPSSMTFVMCLSNRCNNDDVFVT